MLGSPGFLRSFSICPLNSRNCCPSRRNKSHFSLAFMLLFSDIINTLIAFTTMFGILTSFASSLILFMIHYNTRPLIILESAQARYTLLYSCSGIRPVYSTLLLETAQLELSSWKPPNQRNTTQNIYKRAPFLPLSSAQVPCPSSRANCCPISPRAMHRRLPLKSAQATTTANTRMCES